MQVAPSLIAGYEYPWNRRVRDSGLDRRSWSVESLVRSMLSSDFVLGMKT